MMNGSFDVGIESNERSRDGIDSAEWRYDAESVRVIPVESRIESIRCKHETNTGIFCVSRWSGMCISRSEATGATYDNGDSKYFLDLLAFLEIDQLLQILINSKPYSLIK